MKKNINTGTSVPLKSTPTFWSITLQEVSYLRKINLEHNQHSTTFEVRPFADFFPLPRFSLGNLIIDVSQAPPVLSLGNL